MNIYNLNDKIVIQVEEFIGESLPIDYAIYEYTTSGCTKGDPILAGVLLSGNKVHLKLPDGKYSIVILGPLGQLGDIQEDFYVFYNRLPELVSKFRKLVCSENCDGCENDLTEELLKLYYNVSIFLNCTGLIEALPAYKYLSCRQNTASQKEDQNRVNFGRYNLNFKSQATSLILIFLLELHKLNISKSREEDSHLYVINDMFKLELIKNCLSDSNTIYDKLESIINVVNCECNE